MTHDSYFEEVVISLGGSVRSNFNASYTAPLTFQKITMLDYHPDIDCTIKMLSKRGEDLNDLDLSGLVNSEELTETYNGVYMID